MNIKSIEATVGVISIIFGVYVFLFADAWIGWKIGLLVFVSATIAIRILWSRINKKILIQLPIILKKRSDLSQAPKNMIQYYGSRSELPFEQILSNAHKIDMVAVTFSDLRVHNMGSIIGAVKRGVQFTFLILDPSSHHKQTLEIYHVNPAFN